MTMIRAMEIVQMKVVGLMMPPQLMDRVEQSNLSTQNKQFAIGEQSRIEGMISWLSVPYPEDDGNLTGQGDGDSDGEWGVSGE